MRRLLSYGPTRQFLGAGNGGDQLVSFRLSDAQRIASVVSDVEKSRRGRRGSALPRAACGGGGGVFTASFSGSWLKGTDKVLTVLGATAPVANITSDILYSTATRKCFVTMIDSKYVLISSECA